MQTTGNDEQFELLKRNPTLAAMIAARGNDVITLYRVCSKLEACKTLNQCLAGGEEVMLTSQAPTEAATVQQVANSESMIGGASDDVRLARLQAILRAKGGNVAISTVRPAREVVEYSTGSPATQFDGFVIKVGVNRAFTKPGSALSFERGVVVQIGTPLAFVEAPDEVMAPSRPSSRASNRNL